ncbi:MAG TPA: PKD domain-containing protein [Conexibacter sp.]|nr:PKD domain-containing protein [Conexibacter sp.]
MRTTVNGDPGPYLPLALLHDNVDVQRTTLATTRKPSGQEVSERHGGTSARRLVELAGLDPAHVITMAIDRPNATAGAVVLTRSEIVDGFVGDPRGIHEATFDPDYNLDPLTRLGTEVHFFRPLRDDLDVNQLDALDPPTGADLVVHLTTLGPRLVVSASADRMQAPSGASIHFTAKVDPPSPGATFTWDFGDGDTTTGAAEIDHAYAAAQSYVATVTALTRDGGSGAGLVRVQVGTPSDGGGGGTSGGGGGATGAGGGSGSRDAPSEGPAHGGAKRSGGRRRAQGRASARAVAHAQHGRQTASVPEPADPSAARSAGVVGAPIPRGAGPATPSGAVAEAVRRARAAPLTGGRHPLGATSTASANRVSGVLLASDGASLRTAAGLVATPDDARARRDAAARATASPSQPLSWWLLAGLGLVLLLGLGVARESGLHLTSRLGAS